jgi:tRNA threonylcarbamoyladenosine biosynthesis protein TsaE
MHFDTQTEEETIAAGRAIARALPPRAVVSLHGDLGAGKTTLVKGIAQERAGVDPDEVSSPTFTLIHEYGHPVRVFHIDLYRLEQARELATLGLEELEEREALILIEWARRFPQLPLALTHEIRITHAGPTARHIHLVDVRPAL